MPGPRVADTADSPERLAALRSYGILDTPRESDFDDLVELAARLCGAPISVVNLIEDHRQWFKAEVGLGIDETPLDVSICRHVLLQPGLTIISDLREDPRMCLNPLVTADAGLRFYAGCLLQTAEGHGLGTLCILDRQPRTLTDEQQSALVVLARQVMTQLELRRSLLEKDQLLLQKEMLLKEVNHRTKNHLQLIIGLIQLQIRQMSDPQAQAALVDTCRRITSIAAVHEKLYQADQVEAVNAGAYLAQVIAGIQGSASSQTFFVVDMDSVVLSLDKAIPLALILNELITNALKYAYDETTTGSVSISLKTVDGQIRLIVADQGKGLPQGFEVRKNSSVGMRIIRSLAQQLKGDIAFIDSAPGLECRLLFAH
ncbi:histidine kinase dimerization/phosphoacceptor domain -containing protein [Pseudomonas alliivorans]|nr:histidine kinase dimerization/phosphoacceptor domain -containing protein [Pseudomonas alliivorans]MEE4699564.1 histidine kinase dimerization/phosphoacceptor domain -containing protein [Pseudomonas alliivorans]MEE4734797.1 histidine kinase dimerization/phosphoacceptor domain -containing protein [Pseudomonas alliivorans]MEE5113952.1 histidine kinase dimerization/phosphoacceptor domain -containing protein [Pseudomonas alliivorans]